MSSSWNKFLDMQGWHRSKDNWLRIILALVMFGAMVALTHDALPDYQGYSSIFSAPKIGGNTTAAFYHLVEASKRLEVNYFAFRLLVLAVGTTVFFFIAKPPPQSRSTARNTALYYLSYALLISVFVFEFYVIRLRGGVSCLLFALAFFPEIAKREISQSIALRTLQAGLLILSLAFHPATFSSLAMFCIPPLLFIKYAPPWILDKKALLLIGLAVIWSAFLFKVVCTVEERGDHLYSPLNPMRFYALTAVPLVVFGILDSPAIRAGKSILEGPNFFSLAFSINYLISALVLAGFYFTGNLSNAGEAIVRVMTLSSLPAVLIIARWGIGWGRMMPTYLLVCNSLFFINTVYL